MPAAITFAPATRKRARARIALAGPSGSGKTYTALMLATAFGGRIAVVDTEHGSASLYADEYSFDHVEPPSYSPSWLIGALAAAGQAGYATVVVDSLSHFWMGTDGMLEQVDRAGKRSGGGNSFAGWKEMRPLERNMVEAMLSYPGHVVVTMRTKTEWVTEVNDKGKTVPRKIGLRPEQREGIEYEFDLVADMDLENELIVTKSRCRVLAGAVVKRPDAKFAQVLVEWLDAGAGAMPTSLDYRDRAIRIGATFDELRALYGEVAQRRLLGVEVIDDTGDAVSLERLIKTRGDEAQAREVAALPMSKRAQGRLFALFSEHGLGGDEHRQTRRDYAAQVLDEPVEHVQQLTEGKARKVIAELEASKPAAVKS
jgi:DNA polymerase III delta prime subunit